MYISESDKILIRQLIKQQLEAFQANDPVTAFSLTSPTIQSKFTLQHFVQTLSTKYSVLLEPRSVMFQGFTLVKNFPALTATIMDREGNLSKAIFVVQHQQDYSWRVHGFDLVGINEKIV